MACRPETDDTRPFGYNLANYEELFDEKTNLFAELLKGGPITRQGETRASNNNQDVVPHLESGAFPVWIGVAGSPQSVIRAAHYGFSPMLAIIGGSPARFAPFAATDEPARAEFWPRYLEVMTLMTNIELYGSQVIPRVRELLA